MSGMNRRGAVLMLRSGDPEICGAIAQGIAAARARRQAEGPGSEGMTNGSGQ